MKKILLIFTILSVLIFYSCEKEANVNNHNENDGVFIHISHGSDDIHRLLMGLQMAVIMSEDKDVLVYFDITGIDAVLNNSKDYEHANFPSSLTQLNKLLSKGVVVMACPTCLKAADKTESDLINGVKIAKKEEFFSFTKGRILTIDY
jgi:predicted peroxiredoxin